MAKYYNVYDRDGDMEFRDDTSFATLEEALIDVSDAFPDYKFTIIIHSDKRIELNDYQARVEAYWEMGLAEEEAEETHEQQQVSDYMQSIAL